ncbi:MAG: hypothetical protein WBW74_15610 [Xanthobacteraceae bacterium]
MFAKSKKIITVAVAAAALAAASLAATGDAVAKNGGGGGGKGGHGWHGGFRSSIVVIDNGCWRWVPGYGRVWVCNY